MSDNELIIAPLFVIGPLSVTGTVVATWGVMAALTLVSWSVTRSLRIDPKPLQAALEAIVETIEAAIREVSGEHTARLLPFVATLWIFLVTANLTGLIPGLHSPTRDLSATAALAFLVFLSTHWYGVRILGWWGYLRHYVRPNPVLLPLHLLTELSRTIALAVRLFGNMMSLEMAAVLILLVAGFLVPVPILMLHVIEALVQAYIFGMLALIYVTGSIQSQELTLKARGV